ncbi:MAG: 23S rRNA (guanosine(2251)-2'-O)-methyltransferase RlmB [Thermoleophilaceae bacterium]|nr:23S rRNA (guanosine(2251)-2'-O)-methyltransferase RlmB [Thermoleophilaceae bacterium]
MIVYGRNPVREALRGRRRVTRVWLTGDGPDAGRLAREAEGAVEVERVGSAEAIERLCGSPDHQGVCADAGDYPYASADALLEPEDALVVCLDEVQDPHNLGAVCRAAECAGATGVVVPERRSVHVTPAVCSASAGAVEHLSVARVRNLAEFLERAKRHGAWSYGADAAAQVPYDRPDYRGKVVLVLGSEGRGIRPRVAGACDELVALPVRGRLGSLNVSAAAAALLYGILQRRVALDSVR